MQPQYVPRNPNGSIDYDFYRRRAARLRREKVRSLVSQAADAMRPLIAIVLLAGTVLAVPTRAPEIAKAAIGATETIAALATDRSQH